MLPPPRVIEVAVLVTVPPPHWGEAGGDATVTFAGKLSVSDTLVMA
jgi:hypothetical protein